MSFLYNSGGGQKKQKKQKMWQLRGKRIDFKKICFMLYIVIQFNILWNGARKRINNLRKKET